MKPLSVVGWRDASLLDDHYVVVEDWPEMAYVTPGFGGSRTGGTTAAAWAVMKLLGEPGYLDLTSRMLEVRDRLVAGLKAIDGIRLPIPEPELINVVYDGVDVTVNQLLNGMHQRGWLHFSVLDPRMVQFILDPARSTCSTVTSRTWPMWSGSRAPARSRTSTRCSATAARGPDPWAPRRVLDPVIAVAAAP